MCCMANFAKPKVDHLFHNVHIGLSKYIWLQVRNSHRWPLTTFTPIFALETTLNEPEHMGKISQLSARVPHRVTCDSQKSDLGALVTPLRGGVMRLVIRNSLVMLSMEHENWCFRNQIAVASKHKFMENIPCLVVLEKT